MGCDEKNTIDKNGLNNQLQQLNAIMGNLMNTLGSVREEIFGIANHSLLQIQYLEEQFKKVSLKTNQINQKLKKISKGPEAAGGNRTELEDQLPEPGINLLSEDIYPENPQQQMELQQVKARLESQRNELACRLNSWRDIKSKADMLLGTTGMAYKVLEGDGDKPAFISRGAVNDQQSALPILQAIESVQCKIARELHDGPAQAVASMLIRLDLLERSGESDNNRIFQELSLIKAISRESLDGIRRIIYELKPVRDRGEPFYCTLNNYFEELKAKYGFNTDFTWSGEKKIFPIYLEEALFRLVQESINNIRKHAGVNRATVLVKDNGQALSLMVRDEGAGFQLNNSHPDQENYGIAGMRERVKLLSGSMHINSTPGKGTQVTISIPLEGDA